MSNTLFPAFFSIFIHQCVPLLQELMVEMYIYFFYHLCDGKNKIKAPSDSSKYIEIDCRKTVKQLVQIKVVCYVHVCLLIPASGTYFT